VVEGGYGATVGETGPEEPGLSTVLIKHAKGDLDPVRELPYRLAAIIAASRSRTDGSIRLRVDYPPKTACVEGGVHRWKADAGSYVVSGNRIDFRWTVREGSDARVAP